MDLNDRSLITFIGGDDNLSKCGYCKGEKCSNNIGMWTHKMMALDYQNLIDIGWRRSGTYMYKPTNSNTCCPLYTIRCDVSTNLKVPPTKKQRQVIRKMVNYLKNGRVQKPVEIEKLDNSKISIKTPTQCEEEDEIIETEAKDVTLKKSLPKPGLGANHSLKKCKKARLERVAKAKARNEKLSTDPAQAAAKTIHRVTTLIELYAELNNDPSNKHNLEVKTIKVDKKNSDFTERNEECFNVYHKYQVKVHGDKPEDVTMESYSRFLVDNCLTAVKVSSCVNHHQPQPWINKSQNYRANENPGKVNADVIPGEYGAYHQLYLIDDKVIAVAILDFLPRCISSVYFYYDPDYSFLSMGTFSSLREILWTNSMRELHNDLRYYYMGFYLHSCPKMKYKAKYEGSSLLCYESHDWIDIKECLPKLDVNKYSRFSEIGEGSEEKKIDICEYLDNLIILMNNEVELLGSFLNNYTDDLNGGDNKMGEIIVTIKKYIGKVGKENAMKMIYHIMSDSH